MMLWMAVMIAVLPAPKAIPWTIRRPMRTVRLSATRYANEASTETAIVMLSSLRRPMKSRYLPVITLATTAPRTNADDANPAAASPAENQATASPPMHVIRRQNTIHIDKLRPLPTLKSFVHSFARDTGDRSHFLLRVGNRDRLTGPGRGRAPVPLERDAARDRVGPMT